MLGDKPVSDSLMDAVRSVVSSAQKDSEGTNITEGDMICVVEGAHEGMVGTIVEFPTSGRATIQLHEGRQVTIMNESFISERSVELYEANKLDPVGKEDDDIDNDGDSDDSDEYLMKRRKAIKKAMKEGNCPCCDGACQCESDCRDCDCGVNEDAQQVDELKVATKIRAAAERSAQASDERTDDQWDGSGSPKRAAKLQAKSDRMRSMIAKKHGQRAAKGVDNLAKIKSGEKPSHANRRAEMKAKNTPDADSERWKKAAANRKAKTEAGIKARRERLNRERSMTKEDFESIDELKVATKIRAAAQRAADAEGERVDSEWDGSGSPKRAAKFQAKSDKMRSMIAKKHGDRAAKGVDNLAKIRSGLKPSHARVRNTQKSDSLANRPSTSIAKSGDRKGKVTRASAERLKSAIRNRRK
jgi:hypothetical protein